MLENSSTPLPRELGVLYLDLLKQMLPRGGLVSGTVDVKATNWKRHLLSPLQRALRARGYRLVSGTDVWTFMGETMITPERLENLHECVEQVLADETPGDFIEAGVWRGGAAILMRAILFAHGVSDRTVWLADSFQGFPTSATRSRSIDQGVDFTAGMGERFLTVDVEAVKGNLERYGLLDDQVQFLVGWFADTLPKAPIQSLAILRLDGDLYESTWDSLTALYPRVSPGGYVIVDDYGFHEACRQAVNDYRRQQQIREPIRWIDREGVYWRRDSLA
jgi:hypothetical protein